MRVQEADEVGVRITVNFGDSFFPRMETTVRGKDVIVVVVVCSALWCALGSPTVTQAVLSAKADVKHGSRTPRSSKNIAEPDWSMYHKTAKIEEELKEMVKDCTYARMELIDLPGEQLLPEQEVHVVVLTQAAKSRLRELVASAIRPRQQIVAVFGEHGRELISSEVALNTVKMVCQGSGPRTDAAREELEHTELHLLPALGAPRRAVRNAACLSRIRSDRDRDRRLQHRLGQLGDALRPELAGPILVLAPVGRRLLPRSAERREQPGRQQHQP